MPQLYETPKGWIILGNQRKIFCIFLFLFVNFFMALMHADSMIGVFEEKRFGYQVSKEKGPG